jgi:pre-60S factor REI1
VYNLKRRISPVSSTTFEDHVVISSVTSQEREDTSNQKACGACSKVFYSKQVYQGHLRSQSHARNVAVNGIEDQSASQHAISVTEMNTISLETLDGSSAERFQETVEEEFTPSVCLFCTTVSSDMQDNLTHMQRNHGLFIPDQEHLIDIEVFLGYLFAIISEFQECLYCSVTKSTVEGIQHHMKDKGHCKINIKQGSEWQLFYEYPDSESETENSKSRMPPSHNMVDQITSTDELHLPSGKILGHRSQVSYHRPNITTRASSPALTASTLAEGATTSPTPGATGSNETRPDQQLTVRKSDMLGMIGVSSQQQRALRPVEKMMLKRESQARDANQAGVQKTANRQKFFKVFPGKTMFCVDDRVLISWQPDAPGRSNG